MRTWLLSWREGYKRIALISTDLLLIWLALWLAFSMHWGLLGSVALVVEGIWLFLAAPLIALAVFMQFGMYRVVLRYTDIEALIIITKAVLVSTVLLALLIFGYAQAPGVLLRSMVVNYGLLSLVFIGGLRVLLRNFFNGNLHSLVGFFVKDTQKQRVAIYGAGSAGHQLLASLRLDMSTQPVAFIDDNIGIDNRTIAGLRVYKPQDIAQMLQDTQATHVLLAIPSISQSRRREILNSLVLHPVQVRSVPGLLDLTSGKITINDFEEVSVADLLGREAVAPDLALFNRCIENKIVMVTGAGGSIGSELCRQIVTSGVTTLILFEHAEYNLYQIHYELTLLIKRKGLTVNLMPVLGSISVKKHLLDVMQTWAVDTVYHAAAYKHVPMVEHNTAGGLINNVFGTLNTAQAAIQAGVKNFVLISTDKAVRPTNIMGGTKRLAEMVLQALSAEKYLPLFNEKPGEKVFNKTRFTMVRFGNVLGSSGSVIPLFREQIASGGPVTVTHPDITRYFMTIPEAAQLVIQAGSIGQGGDVFVLDMGKPVLIAELAEKMVHLTGLTVRTEDNPSGEIVIEFSGLRPGEKLYEELLIGDNVSGTEHPKIMRANETFMPWSEFCTVLEQLSAAAEQNDCIKVRQLLHQYVDGYLPQGEIVDLLYQERGPVYLPHNLLDFPTEHVLVPAMPFAQRYGGQ